MVLAIEPMVTAGRHQVRMADDHWSIFTQDGSLAAHFEFTIAITADGSARADAVARARPAGRRLTRAAVRPRRSSHLCYSSSSRSEPLGSACA